MSLEATLDVEVGDVVTFTFTIENTGTEPVELTFSSGKRTDVVVRDTDTDEVVWRWSDGRMFTQALETVTFPPGEHIEQTHVWETPEPGEYVAIATLEGDIDVEARATLSI